MYKDILYSNHILKKVNFQNQDIYEINCHLTIVEVYISVCNKKYFRYQKSC
jgi:hypothetical protein